MNVIPHVVQRTSGRRSAVPMPSPKVRLLRLATKRKLIEQGFSWAKTVGRIRQEMVHGLQRVDQMFVLTNGSLQPHAHAHLGQIRLQAQRGGEKASKGRASTID